MDSLHYTNERQILILIALLKVNGIRKIVASPGATNVTFVGSVQQDPFFEEEFYKLKYCSTVVYMVPRA